MKIVIVHMFKRRN